MQEPAQTAANVETDERAKTLVNTGSFAHIQDDSDLDKMAGMGVEGLERRGVSGIDSNDLAKSPKSRAAKCAARAADAGEIDPELARVVAAWPRLSTENREEIIRLIE